MGGGSSVAACEPRSWHPELAFVPTPDLDLWPLQLQSVLQHPGFPPFSVLGVGLLGTLLQFGRTRLGE